MNGYYALPFLQPFIGRTKNTPVKKILLESRHNHKQRIKEGIYHGDLSKKETVTVIQ